MTAISAMIASAQPVAAVIISVALMLFFGFAMTRITKLLRLPNVTAYIVAGILLGPYCLGLVPQRIIDGMDFLSDVALAFIAFSTGEFFKLSVLKKNGWKVVWITVLEATLASVLVFVLTFWVLRLPLSFSVVLAALASATAPASTMMTIRQTGAKGDFVNTLLQVVALDDVVGLVLYSVAISVALAAQSGGGHGFSFETLVLPRETQTLVSEFLTYVSGNTSEVMFFAALLVMITSASAAFRAMAAIVGEIHGAKRFGIVRSTIVSVIFSVAFLLVLYLCILLMLTGKHFLLWLDALLPHVSIVWSWTWLRFLILFAILLMMILILYRLTTPRRPQHRVLPGAVFSAVAIVCMSILLSWLIGSSTKYSLVYGSLASVVILLFWFQAFGLLLILGVVLNHALEATAPPDAKV